MEREAAVFGVLVEVSFKCSHMGGLAFSIMTLGGGGSVRGEAWWELLRHRGLLPGKDLSYGTLVSARRATVTYYSNSNGALQSQS